MFSQNCVLSRNSINANPFVSHSHFSPPIFHSNFKYPSIFSSSILWIHFYLCISFFSLSLFKLSTFFFFFISYPDELFMLHPNRFRKREEKWNYSISIWSSNDLNVYLIRCCNIVDNFDNWLLFCMKEEK